jgi:hemerythrin superfamily protein
MKLQKNVKEVIKNCKKFINKYTKFKCIQKKQPAPKLNITIKLDKEGAPIRPIVNYKYAPSYYIKKITANWLKINFVLQFEYNVENSLKCAEKIKELDIQTTYKMLTLDITNLYTNIPTNETIVLIKKK